MARPPAWRNNVEVRTTPEIPELNLAPKAAAEIVPRLVPTRNTGTPGKRLPRSLTTADISMKCFSPSRKSSFIPSLWKSEGASTMTAITPPLTNSPRLRTTKLLGLNRIWPFSSRSWMSPLPPGKSTAIACGFCGKLARKYDWVTFGRVGSVTISCAKAATVMIVSSMKKRILVFIILTAV